MIDSDVSLRRLIHALTYGTPSFSSDHDLNPGLAAVVNSSIKYRPASVLIPVIQRASGPKVILTRRAGDLRHHAGQVSFPGGKQDETDADALAAALREASEEIGLHRHQADIIGAMAVHRTVTAFEVTPFVAQIASDFQATADPIEVAEIFEVPLGFLLNRDNFQIHSRVWHGQTRSFYAIPYGPYYIWGATARILRALADQVAKCR